MKRWLTACGMVLGVAAPLILMGARSITTYFGVVHSVESGKITIVQKNGVEKKLKVEAETKSFVSGRVVPVKAIRRHSRVQITADDDDVCLQIVVDEVPR